MIGSCDHCDRQNVPVSNGMCSSGEATQCFVCQGDIADPYGEQASATLPQLRELVALQATDGALWSDAATAVEAYMQQALRYLTRAIEGEWTFEEAKAAIQEMMP